MKKKTCGGRPCGAGKLKTVAFRKWPTGDNPREHLQSLLQFSQSAFFWTVPEIGGKTGKRSGGTKAATRMPEIMVRWRRSIRQWPVSQDWRSCRVTRRKRGARRIPGLYLLGGPYCSSGARVQVNGGPAENRTVLSAGYSGRSGCLQMAGFVCYNNCIASSWSWPSRDVASGSGSVVEHLLAKEGVASSNLVFRSIFMPSLLSAATGFYHQR